MSGAGFFLSAWSQARSRTSAFGLLRFRCFRRLRLGRFFRRTWPRSAGLASVFTSTGLLLREACPRRLWPRPVWRPIFWPPAWRPRLGAPVRRRRSTIHGLDVFRDRRRRFTAGRIVRAQEAFEAEPECSASLAQPLRRLVADRAIGSENLCRRFVAIQVFLRARRRPIQDHQNARENGHPHSRHSPDATIQKLHCRQSPAACRRPRSTRCKLTSRKLDSALSPDCDPIL